VELNKHALAYLELKRPVPCAMADVNPRYFWVGNKWRFCLKLSANLEAAFLFGPIYDNLKNYISQTDVIRIYSNKIDAETALMHSLASIPEKQMLACLEYTRGEIVNGKF
jgi:hypothetical protein